MKRLKFILLFWILLSLQQGQAQDRFSILEEELNELAITQPSLKNKPQINLSEISLNSLLRFIAETNQLNLNIDPELKQKVLINYSNETIITILIDLARQHNLDFRFTGTIINVYPYKDPLAGLPPPPKNIVIDYDSVRRLITMNLERDSLVHVAKKITQLTNQNIVILPGLENKTVSGYIQSFPIENALEKIAIANDLKLNKTKDSVLILEPLAPNEQIIPRQTGITNPNYVIKQTTNNGLSQNSINVTNTPTEQYVSLDLINTPINEAIRQVAQQAGIQYFIYTELAGTITAKIDTLSFGDALNYLLNGTQYTYQVQNNIYLIGNRQEEGIRSFKLIKLQYRSVDSILVMIPAELRKGVDIKEFDEYNSLLVSGSQPQIQEIESLIGELDKIVPVVLVEFIIMDVVKRRTTSSGLQFGISDSVNTGGRLFGGGLDFNFSSNDINRFISQIGLNNLFNIGRVTPNFYANLRALEESANVDLRQTPKLSTLNGHEASYSTGSERFYLEQQVNIGGGLTPITTTTQIYRMVEAKLSIRIKPYVSGDGQVTMNIEVQNADFIGQPKLNEPPPRATNQFNSSIRVKNEEMILLGGIERLENNESGSGTPFLSRIPILKWLFSTRSKTKGKVISIVFIKPTIVY